MADRTTTEIVFRAETWAEDWPPTNLVSLIAWLQNKLHSVLPEYRHAVKCVFEAEVDGGSPYPTLTILYDRPETPFERDERLADVAATVRRLAELREAELAAARAVLARYGETD